MGRLSDHLLAHTGPTADSGPADLLVSPRQHAPRGALGAKVFLTSRERGFMASEEQPALTGLGILAVPSLVSKAPLGTCVLSLSSC